MKIYENRNVRGKKLSDSKFLEGILLIYDSKFYIAHLDKALIGVYLHSNVPLSFEYDEVDPLTLGECTRCLDSKDVWIFEGDVIQFNHHFISTVWRIDDDSMKFVSNYKSLKTIQQYIKDGVYIEVIGNIHDNPELMGG